MSLQRQPSLLLLTLVESLTKLTLINSRLNAIHVQHACMRCHIARRLSIQGVSCSLGIDGDAEDLHRSGTYVERLTADVKLKRASSKGQPFKMRYWVFPGDRDMPVSERKASMVLRAF